MHVSYDEHPELFSLINRRAGGGLQQARQSIRDLMQESPDFVLPYFQMLPLIDSTIARLYYIERLSQDQISALLSITQAAVSRRLKYIIVRVKFLLKMPTLNPIQVREDFRSLFSEELFEFAYFFYWEHAQNRVKYFIKTSQSGAANKFARVMAYLEEVVAQDDEAIADDEPAMLRKYLALQYHEYFQYTRSKSNIITFLYKKNDVFRTRALEQGPSILEELAAA